MRGFCGASSLYYIKTTYLAMPSSYITTSLRRNAVRNASVYYGLYQSSAYTRTNATYLRDGTLKRRW